MAISFANMQRPPAKFPLGDRFGVVRDVTFDSSYASGGEPLPSNGVLGVTSASQVSGVLVIASNPAAIAYTVRWDKTNNKLRVFTGASVEVTATTDLSTLMFTLLFIVRS